MLQGKSQKSGAVCNKEGAGYFLTKIMLQNAVDGLPDGYALKNDG